MLWFQLLNISDSDDIIVRIEVLLVTNRNLLGDHELWTRLRQVKALEVIRLTERSRRHQTNPLVHVVRGILTVDLGLGRQLSDVVHFSGQIFKTARKLVSLTFQLPARGVHFGNHRSQADHLTFHRPVLMHQLLVLLFQKLELTFNTVTSLRFDVNFIPQNSDLFFLIVNKKL